MIDIFNTDERYYVRNIKGDKKDIISDFDDKEIIVYKDIKVDGDLRSTGLLYLGYPKKQISNKKGEILYTSLERGSANNSEVLVFKKDKWMSEKILYNYNINLSNIMSKIKNSILEPEYEMFNDLNICGVSLDKNDIIYKTILMPENVYKNIVNIKISYFSRSTGIGKIGICLHPLDKYSNIDNLNFIYSLEEIVPGFNSFNKSTFVSECNRNIKNIHYLLAIKRDSSSLSGDMYYKPINVTSIDLEYYIDI